jgi:peroxiredoxin Q/BCP
MKLALIALLTLIGIFVWSRVAHTGESPRIGEPAPTFSLPDQHGTLHALDDYRGQWVVLYFYPKADTPGCTREACAFRDDLHKLKKLGAQVLGVSVDDSDSHAKFAEKYHLPFPLLADAGGNTAAAYGALTNLGLFRIAKRHTFLIDPAGNVAKIYTKVDTSRHSQEIIDDLTRLRDE